MSPNEAQKCTGGSQAIYREILCKAITPQEQTSLININIKNLFQYKTFAVHLQVQVHCNPQNN